MTPTHRGAPTPSAAPDVLDQAIDRMAEQQTPSAAEPAGPLAEDRTDPPTTGGELETLTGFLDYFRASVLWKTAELDDELAARRSVVSAISVTGLLRHLADVERYWFRELLGGVPEADVGYRWMDPADPEAEWELEPGASLEQSREDYAAACAASRSQLVGRELSEELRRPTEVVTVRWVLVHMIEETGRHLGHLDILTELLDGRTGE